MVDLAVDPAADPAVAAADTPAANDTPADPPPPIVAITVDDDLLHIAPAAEVLAHLADEAGRPGAAVDAQTWEFFTRDGTVLVQVTDPDTGAVTLEPDAQAEAPSDLTRQLLLDRIDAFLARVQVELDRDLATGIRADHRRVPRLSGDLPDVVNGLAAVLTVPKSLVQPDSRDWVHNLGHRLRGN